MVSGSAAFFELKALTDGKDVTKGQILETDIWIKKEAIDKAKTLGKKHKVEMGVYQCKQVFATDTGEATIDF